MTNGEPLGSAVDEAVRLVEAFGRWAEQHTPVRGEASGAPTECKYCPLCVAAAALRQGQPEVFEHMGNALESLVAAVRAGVSGHEEQWSRPSTPDVEHVDIR
jgi:hypothetical protein